MWLRDILSPSTFDTPHSFDDVRRCSPQQILQRFYDHCSLTSKKNIKTTPLHNTQHLRDMVSTLPLSSEQKMEWLSLIMFNHQRDGYPFAPVDREWLCNKFCTEWRHEDAKLITQALLASKQEDHIGKKNHTLWHEVLVSTWAPADILHHFAHRVEPELRTWFYSPKNSAKRKLHSLLSKNTNEHSFTAQEGIQFRSEIIHALFDFVVGNHIDSPEALNTFVGVVYHKATTCPHMDGRRAFDDCIDFMKQQESNVHRTERIAKAYQLCKNKFAGKEPMMF